MTNLFDRMTYRVPLWGGRREVFMAELVLPLDLRVADVTRIKAFLDSIAMEDPAPPEVEREEQP